MTLMKLLLRTVVIFPQRDDTTERIQTCTVFPKCSATFMCLASWLKRRPRLFFHKSNFFFSFLSFKTTFLHIVRRPMPRGSTFCLYCVHTMWFGEKHWMQTQVLFAYKKTPQGSFKCCASETILKQQRTDHIAELHCFPLVQWTSVSALASPVWSQISPKLCYSVVARSCAMTESGKIAWQLACCFKV